MERTDDHYVQDGIFCPCQLQGPTPILFIDSGVCWDSLLAVARLQLVISQFGIVSKLGFAHAKGVDFVHSLIMEEIALKQRGG